jgi:ribosomal 30S subunit maturation factor RimM
MEYAVMDVTPLHRLESEEIEKILLSCSVEVSGELIGHVSDLISDKYKRILGIEVRLESGNSSFIVPIPHNWIESLDLNTRKIQVSIPSDMQTNILARNQA